MLNNQGASKFGIVIITSIISIGITLGVVAVVISQYGVEKVATEVSPFVENAQKRVLEGIVPPTEQTTPKTEADVIMDSVAQNQGSSVLIYEGNTTTGEFLGRGIMVSSNGFIITDANLIKASSTYSVAVLGTKEQFGAGVIKIEDGLAVLKITISTTLVANFGNNFPVNNDLVVAISGDAKMNIGTGIVTNTTNESIVTNIYGNLTPGSPLMAKNGNVIGISLVGQQKAGEAIFKTLTKDDIAILTTTVDGGTEQTVLN